MRFARAGAAVVLRKEWQVASDRSTTRRRCRGM